MSNSLTSHPESEFVCECDELNRSACAGLPFYKEYEDRLYCVLHLPDQDKHEDFNIALQRKIDSKDFNCSGVWFPGSVSFAKFVFRAAADFSRATFSEEADFSFATFSEEANFGDATFSAEADFSNATFSEKADFTYATFSGEAHFILVTFRDMAFFTSATFSARAIFSLVTFSAAAAAFFTSATFSASAEFSNATFSAEASFDGVTFSAEADFSLVTFSAAADFSNATFSAEASFRSVTFSGEADFNSTTVSGLVAFNSATFADHVKFAGAEKHQVFIDTSRLDLQFARIEKPDRVSLHTLSLRPHWFVNIDARKFGFTNVNWGRLSIKEEISRLKQNDISSPHHLLAIACRNLAVNAEENHRYEEASKFRYMAMEARRLENWRGFAPWRLSWWYWLASGYGERVLRAFLMLLAVLVLFAVLYMTTTGGWEAKGSGSSTAGVKPPTNFATALTYSAGVMTLQRPEPRPITPAAQTLVLVETILGPLQAALLALAIRRKFMR